jgi:hypothetical protein
LSFAQVNWFFSDILPYPPDDRILVRDDPVEPYTKGTGSSGNCGPIGGGSGGSGH